MTVLTYSRAKSLAEHIIGHVRKGHPTALYVLADGERRVVQPGDCRAPYFERYCAEFLIGVYSRGVMVSDVLEDLRAAGRLGPAA